eukprot:6185349-Pleurochrysis_carterae.AAC.3
MKAHSRDHTQRARERRACIKRSRRAIVRQMRVSSGSAFSRIPTNMHDAVDDATSRATLKECASTNAKCRS